jgi:hypothetical protein
MPLASPQAARLPDTNRLEGNIVFAGFLGTMNRHQVDIGDAVLQGLCRREGAS